MRARLENDVLAKKPNWMTLSCGVNDVWHGEAGVLLEAYMTNIADIVNRCQKAGVKVMILTSTQIGLPVDNPDNLKLAAYNAFLRKFAKELNLPLADLNADMVAEQEALKNAAGADGSLTVDGVHMNNLGNRMMARGVLRAFGLDEGELTAAESKWPVISNAISK
jgi:lysophospholipase L1-like esterase